MTDANPNIFEEILGIIFVPHILIMGSMVNGFINLFGLENNINSSYFILASLLVLPISYFYSLLLLNAAKKIKNILDYLIQSSKQTSSRN